MAWRRSGSRRIARAAALQAGQGVVHDVEGILTAWIVAGQDDEVAACARGLAHQRTLAAIAIATAAEDGDDTSCTSALSQKVFGRGGEISQCVVAVRVVPQSR